MGSIDARVVSEAASIAKLCTPMLSGGDRLEVAAIRGTTLIRVVVRGDDALRSQEAAEKVMDAYMAAAPADLTVKRQVVPTVPTKRTR